MTKKDTREQLEQIAAALKALTEGETELELEADSPLYSDFLELQKRLREAQKIQSKNIETQGQKLSLEQIGKMTAGIGHEVNNTLAIVDGQIKMIGFRLQEMHIEDPTLNRFMDGCSYGMNRIKNIIDGLRAMTRGNTQKKQLINPEELVEKTVNFVKEVYAREEITVEFHSELSASVEVEGYFVQLSQVLLNILSNARDVLLDKAHAKIEVSVELSENRTVCIGIKDNGSGIPVYILDKIWDPFFTTKDSDKGSGIGMHISKQIIEEHGGRIDLESSSEGTEFSIYLPKYSNQSVTVSPYRILVVEDEPIVADYIQEILEDCGYESDIAYDGLKALEKLEQNTYDVMLTDMKMPRMHGLELIQTATEKKLIDWSQIIILTGGYPKEWQEQVQSAAMHILKPVEEENLQAALSKFFTQYQRAG